MHCSQMVHSVETPETCLIKLNTGMCLRVTGFNRLLISAAICTDLFPSSNAALLLTKLYLWELLEPRGEKVPSWRGPRGERCPVGERCPAGEKGQGEREVPTWREGGAQLERRTKGREVPTWREGGAQLERRRCSAGEKGQGERRAKGREVPSWREGPRGERCPPGEKEVLSWREVSSWREGPRGERCPGGEKVPTWREGPRGERCPAREKKVHSWREGPRGERCLTGEKKVHSWREGPRGESGAQLEKPEVNT
ncbi:hypothetical protein BsWGS_17540 [Bradybaena similaris]